jgi:hypothetical protein
MSTVYEIDIETGTRYGIVNTTKLQAELEADHVITATLESVVIDGTDVDITYATALPTSPINHVTHMESIVAMHDGAAINTDVDPVLITPPSDISKNLAVHGETFSATLNTDTNFDISFSSAVSLQGATIEITNHTDGDWLRIAMIPPSTTTELFVLAQGGSDDSEGIPVPPSAAASISSTTALELLLQKYI